jgi:co-chaperonin GroES (HSP10)
MNLRVPKPLADIVLLEEIDTSVEDSARVMRVVAIGPDVRRDALSTGDVVVSGKYAGTRLVLGDSVWWLLREPEVYAVIPQGGK